MVWSDGGGLQVLGLEDGRVVATLPSPGGSAVSPDGRHVAVASERGQGGTVRVLRLEDLSTVLTLGGHGASPIATPVEDVVREVIWGGTNLIVTRGAEGTVRIWCVPAP